MFYGKIGHVKLKKILVYLQALEDLIVAEVMVQHLVFFCLHLSNKGDGATSSA